MRPLKHRSLAAVVLGIGTIALLWHIAGVKLSVLFSRTALRAIIDFCRSAYPPDLSSTFLATSLKAIGETAFIATASIVLASAVALPLSILGTGILWRHGILADGPRNGQPFIMARLSLVIRGLFGFVRAVPELVWALLFVAVVGLGPLAGILALAVSYLGIVGRIYIDIFDTVQPYSLEALNAVGASRVQIFLRAIWPQSVPLLTAYSFYSFECCLRAAVVLGFVGAGGIGYEISVSMRLFQYDQVFTLMIALLVLVVAFDLISRPVRSRLHVVGKKFFGSGRRYVNHQRPKLTVMPLSIRFWLFAVSTIALLYVAINSDLILRLRSSSISLSNIFRFVAGMFPPDVNIAFIKTLLPRIVQTIAVSVLGTIGGICMGGVLSLAATTAFAYDDVSYAAKVLRRTIYYLSRIGLSLLRAIPDLVWVMICIVAVGIGAFAGTLAIALHTGGVLGRIYAELYEEISPQPVMALRSLGARRYQVFLWSVWPQAKRAIASYTILRWDSNVRISTIVGLVGGGGLGQAIFNSVQLGFYRQLTTLILVVYMLVILSDYVSSKINQHLA